MGFKWFLINEEKAQLGHRIATVLTGVQSLETDLGGMGARQIARIAEDIVNQIRKILHGQWSSQYQTTLRELQKAGIALSKAIDEKDDLKELVPVVSQILARASTKLGVKTNNLDALEQPEGGDVSQQDFQLTGQGPQPNQPPQQQQQALPPPQMQQMPQLPPPQGIPQQQMPPSGPSMGPMGMM